MSRQKKSPILLKDVVSKLEGKRIWFQNKACVLRRTEYEGCLDIRGLSDEEASSLGSFNRDQLDQLATGQFSTVKFL